MQGEQGELKDNVGSEVDGVSEVKDDAGGSVDATTVVKDKDQAGGSNDVVSDISQSQPHLKTSLSQFLNRYILHSSWQVTWLDLTFSTVKQNDSVMEINNHLFSFASNEVNAKMSCIYNTNWMVVLFR